MRLLRSSSPLTPALLLAIALGLVGCISLEQEEASYTARMREVDQLAANATPATKAELLTQKDAIAIRYAAVPKDKAKRHDALDRVDHDLYVLIQRYETKVQDESKAASTATAAPALAEIAGAWKGIGVEMTIADDGGFSYSKQAGGTSKSMTGKVSKITDTSFEAGALGITSSFKIDKRPYQDPDGKWHMVVDNTALTRQ